MRIVSKASGVLRDLIAQPCCASHLPRLVEGRHIYRYRDGAGIQRTLGSTDADYGCSLDTSQQPSVSTS